MSNASFVDYRRDVVRLARTMVLKSESSAESINKAIEQIGHTVDYARPETWKYYLNIAGEYHYLDEPMFVKSLDTLTEIEFTKENLFEHRATARAYAYGSSYYRDLVDNFPKQEHLIKGILNPVKIETAMSAENHTILWYDRTLVESNETNLIPELQGKIEAFFTAHGGTSYGLSHELFEGARYAVLGPLIPVWILGIRLANVHSNYTHSFHIWTYLEGEGKLGRFREYLTKKQALWLYRNIRWISRNLGKKYCEERLVEHLLTERGFPLVAFDLTQYVQDMPEELRPTMRAVAVPLNFLEQQPRRKLSKSVKELVEREIPLAKENILYTAETIDRVNLEQSRSQISTRPTKVLESHVIDRSESKPFRLLDTLVNEWAHLSSIKRYNAMLTVNNPQTGEAFTISTKDAFVLYLYLWFKSNGHDMVRVPKFVTERVRRLELPKLSYLRQIASRRYITDEVIKRTYDLQPAIGLIVSTASFNEVCREIHKAALEQFFLWSTQQDRTCRVEVENVCQLFWEDATCDFGNQTMAEWLHERGIEAERMSRFDANLFALDLLDKATGQDLSKQYTLKEIHTAMLSLFKELSSYTIQVIQTTSDSPVIPIGHAIIRIGDEFSVEKEHLVGVVPGGRLIGHDSKDVSTVKAELLGEKAQITPHSLDRTSHRFVPSTRIKPSGPEISRMRIKIGGGRFTVKE